MVARGARDRQEVGRLLSERRAAQSREPPAFSGLGFLSLKMCDHTPLSAADIREAKIV